MITNLGIPTNPNIVGVETNNGGLILTVGAQSAAVGNGPGGIVLYNTADQITNYENCQIAWISNTLRILTGAGGSGTVRSIQIGNSFSIQITIRSAGNTNGAMEFQGLNTGVSGNIFFNFASCTHAQSSGTGYGIVHTPTYNQTSTGAGTDFLINRTETAVGSGAQRFIDCQVASSTKFNVDHTGLITALTVANGSVNAAFTASSAPASANTTIQEWLTIKNQSGTQRYIPCF